MKNDKGITMTSLIIYVIGMVIVIGTISTITTYFYKNVNSSSENLDTTQYTKFSSIILEEVNKERNTIIESKTYLENEMKISYIIFSSGNQYTFKEENNSIYKNQIKICENIENCEFSYEYKDSKYLLNIEFKTNNIDKTGTNAIKFNM